MTVNSDASAVQAAIPSPSRLQLVDGMPDPPFVRKVGNICSYVSNASLYFAAGDADDVGDADGAGWKDASTELDLVLVVEYFDKGSEAIQLGFTKDGTTETTVTLATKANTLRWNRVFYRWGTIGSAGTGPKFGSSYYGLDSNGAAGAGGDHHGADFRVFSTGDLYLAGIGVMNILTRAMLTYPAFAHLNVAAALDLNVQQWLANNGDLVSVNPDITRARIVLDQESAAGQPGIELRQYAVTFAQLLGYIASSKEQLYTTLNVVTADDQGIWTVDVNDGVNGVVLTLTVDNNTGDAWANLSAGPSWANFKGLRIGDSTKPTHMLEVTDGSLGGGGEIGLTLANGANNNLALSGNSYGRITGPTAGFSITGFSAAGAAGTVVRLRNTTSQTMTVINNSGSSTVAVITQTGANVAITGPATATFVYDGTDGKYILVKSW
ncbi:MAG: hypothetical protein WCF84_07130 [Anaerolineae bacterium]